MKKITEIKNLINERKILEVKKKLDELEIELEKLQKFFDESKSLVRNLGKSNMLNKSEIEELIINFERK